MQPDAETVVGLLGSLEDDLVPLVDGVEGLDRLLREEVLPRLAAGAVGLWPADLRQSGPTRPTLP